MRKYFGTDGIRDVANTKLTPELSYKVAKAASYVYTQNLGYAPTVVIGKDTRISGDLIESALVAGFLSSGVRVKLLGVISTPAVAFITKRVGADIAVVISASHNSYEYNGIKFFSNEGMKIPDELEEQIEQVMEREDKSLPTISHDKVGVCENMTDKKSIYINYICDIFKDNLKNSSLKIAIDTANGATYELADTIFGKLGLDYEIINNKPNGININDKCGSTHLEMLKEKVISENFDLGVAYDGDGDRCLLIDEKGNEINGDIILAILSNYLKQNNKLKNNTLVATVMSNLGLKRFAQENSINYIQTNVGDRYVLEKMIEGGYNLGGEQSGHIILSDYNPTGDGILTSLMIISYLTKTNTTLNEASNIITIYPQALVNAKVSNDKKNTYKQNSKIMQKINEIENEFSDNGRVLIRPSGTEPLVRVMIEGENLEYITKKAKELAIFIEENI